MILRFNFFVMPAEAGTQQPRVGAAKESFALADASAPDPRVRGDDQST
jgi:hypothetical protein